MKVEFLSSDNIYITWLSATAKLQQECTFILCWGPAAANFFHLPENECLLAMFTQEAKLIKRLIDLWHQANLHGQSTHFGLSGRTNILTLTCNHCFGRKERATRNRFSHLKADLALMCLEVGVLYLWFVCKCNSVNWLIQQRNN